MQALSSHALTGFPNPSRRSAVLAPNGVAATSQPLASQAGAEMLRAGGSAVDAAIASAAALMVLEPTSNGLGSDAFALVWADQRVQGINGSGRMPAAFDAQALREAGATEMPERGWTGVTVPGAIDMWQALHERFGKLDFERLLQPAIGYAEQGFPVGPVTSVLWAGGYETFAAEKDACFGNWLPTFAPGGAAPVAGERWAAPAMGRCLRTLASRGARDFYEGEIAEAITKYAADTGGMLTRDDLAAHASEWVQPICMPYAGHEVWEIPPNGQGIAALMALGIAERTDHASHAHLSVESWHPQIEAMKLAFADAYTYVADPAKVKVPMGDMLDPHYLTERSALVSDKAQHPQPGKLPRGGTVYLCTADAEGQMVSFIQSNFMGFGSGVVEPQFGISFHNRGAGFDLDDDHLNVAAPGKRPRHTIIPAFLTRDGAPLGPFGVMGGEMQPQGHLQVAHALIDRELNPQAALDAPRWMLESGGTLAVEPGTPAAVVEALRARGHEVVQHENPYGFGRGQVILKLDGGGYAAGSEPRADGSAVGV